MLKNQPARAGVVGDTGSIPGLGRSFGGGNGNPLQYFCLKNSMDRGAWQATVRGVTKSQTQLSARTHTHTHTHTHTPPVGSVSLEDPNTLSLFQNNTLKININISLHTEQVWVGLFFFA